jgi:hypothetical protein
MKNLGDVTLDGREILSGIVIKVEMPKMLGLRFKVATMLMRLASRVSGVQIRVVD